MAGEWLSASHAGFLVRLFHTFAGLYVILFTNFLWEGKIPRTAGHKKPVMKSWHITMASFILRETLCSTFIISHSYCPIVTLSEF